MGIVLWQCNYKSSMTFAYMDGGRWAVRLLQGLTTDILRMMVSLYGMCIPASLVEYLGPAVLQKRDHVSHSYVGAI